jgi:group II intron reverse transcriptase/maturase
MDTKPYTISKTVVWDAWKRVKANKGAPGIDGQSVEGFERKLKDNLYKLWNRMSSGSYFAKPVRLCEIPKADGKVRVLGIPTVEDRVAQMTAALVLEPKVEPRFHPNSYGYRAGKSAIEAVGVTRQRCWQFDWVIDLDIQGFFDAIDHSMMLREVRKYTEEPWILLYVERWLSAPGQEADGKIVERDRGTPQGGVISPLLANIFLHEAFDRWMQEEFPSVPFERYADDIVVHCKTEKQARYVLASIQKRLESWKLKLHPDKTKIVYCKDTNRTGRYEHTKFDFLGYEFRAREARNRQTGEIFSAFNPAIRPKALKVIRDTIRSWQLTRRTPESIEEIAKAINPVVKGWLQYYGVYSRSALAPVIRSVEFAMARWAMRKYKTVHRKLLRALDWLAAIARRQPELFTHWRWRSSEQ